MATCDSFIMYRSFHEAVKALPPKDRAGLLGAFCDYAFDGVEPKLKGAASAVFILVKAQIDANARKRADGADGGRPRTDGASKKTARKKPLVSESENHRFPPEKPLVSETENHRFFEQETSGKPNVNVNENVNENENENERENENVNAGARADVPSADSPSPSPSAPPTMSEPQTEYARQIHAEYERAGLPCSPFPSFLAGEFSRALRTIHSRLSEYKLKSGDVLAAVRNYASVVNDPGDYFSKKLSFDRLLEHKSFPDFLPSAFVKENWRRFGSEAGAGAAAAGESLGEWKEVCPSCGQKSLVWSEQKQSYVCASCGAEHSWEAINGGAEDGRSA